MSLTDIFNDSFKYPISDITKFAIFGIIVVIASLSNIDFGNDIINIIIGIIALIAAILVSGYGVSIAKNAIYISDEIPTLDFKTNFIDGLKMIVVSIVYYIIPAIVVAIVAVVSGLYDQVAEVMTYVAQGTTANIPQDLLYSLGSSSIITVLVAIILFVVFTLLYYVAICRLAKYDSLSESLNIPEAAHDIRRIGVGKVVGWAILLAIIACIIIFIEALIAWIPYIGVLIAAFLASTYLTFITYRSIGLLYSNI